VLVIAGAFDSLWGDTCLEVVLWFAILELVAIVQLAGLKLKVLFHHVQVVFIVLFVDARVPDNQNTEFMERLSDKLALLEILGGVLIKVGFNVNYGYFS